MNVEIIKRAQWLRPGRPRGLAAAGHIHHGGTRLPTILLAVLALVIAAVIYAIRRSHRRRQARQPDAWQQDQPPRSAAPSSDVDMIFGRMANDAKRAVKQSEGRSPQPALRSHRNRLRAPPPRHRRRARDGRCQIAHPRRGDPRDHHRRDSTSTSASRAVSTRQGAVPITPSGTAVIEHAMRESAHLGHGYVGTGHLAMGCLTSCDGLAAKVLNNLGVTYNDLRRAVIELAPANPPKFSSKRAHWERRGS